MTLTEKWKKGELAPMWYYVKYKDGRVGRALLIETPDYYGFYNTCDLNNDVEEVFAPVPSYEEWQELSRQRNQLIRDVNNLAYIQEENQQLKELLNYIRDEIADMPVYAKQMGFGWISEAAYRIDNALGE